MSGKPMCPDNQHRWRRRIYYDAKIMTCRDCHAVHPNDVETVAAIAASLISAGRTSGLVVRR